MLLQQPSLLLNAPPVICFFICSLWLQCMRQLSLLLMAQQLASSESLIILHEQNQFLAEYLQYESCPFCNRSFFRGKLSYHLKHCSLQSPMTKSNKPSPRHVKNSLSAGTTYERCSICNSRIPKYLLEKHSASCSRKQKIAAKLEPVVEGRTSDKEDKIELTIFPRISQSPLPFQVSKTMLVKSYGPKTIRVREELRCLKIAEQVQKVECSYCGRRFSQPASERHIPICSQLKEKEKRQACSQYAKRVKLEGLKKNERLIIYPRSRKSEISKSVGLDDEKSKQMLNYNVNWQQKISQSRANPEQDKGSLIEEGVIQH